ncbi:MAG: HlyD family efflux transporter periplasmic adaptor subunit [Paraglaciecola sp.]|nr:HlyD family efflux transporter periplasmic adaptor subunit [Paraglaciecola sp.]
MMSHNTRIWRHISCSVLGVVLLMSCDTESEQHRYTGYVEAELVYLAAPQAGWLSNMPWQAGDTLTSNTLVFSLDDEQQLAAIKEAQARLAQAKAQERNGLTGAREQEIAELNAQRQQAQVAVDFAASEKTRWNKLVEEGLAPASKSSQVNADYASSIAKLKTITAGIEVARLGVRQELTNSAIAAEQAAQANLEQAQWQLSQRQVISQISGKIEEIFYRQGEFITAGKPVLAILPKDALIIRFFVPQAALSQFNVGQSVNIHADGVTAPIDAHIFHIARSAEFTPPVIYDEQSRQKLMFLLEARLFAQDAGDHLLRPGLPVEVTP